MPCFSTRQNPPLNEGELGATTRVRGAKKRRRLRALFFEAAESVADRGGFFVVFAADGILERGFEFFALGHRFGGAEFLNPTFEGMKFAAGLDEIGTAMLAVEIANFFEAAFDVGDGSFEIAGIDFFRAECADAHHQELRTKLLERPGELGMFGVTFDEIENFHVALGIAQNGVVFFQLKKADIAMMILDGFLLQLGAVLGREMKALFGIVMVHAPFLDAGFEMFDQGFVAEGLFSIRTAHCVHLEEPEIDAELDFFLAVFALKLANHDLPGLVIPRVEQIRNVEIHR